MANPDERIWAALLEYLGLNPFSLGSHEARHHDLDGPALDEPYESGGLENVRTLLAARADSNGLAPGDLISYAARFLRFDGGQSEAEKEGTQLILKHPLSPGKIFQGGNMH